MSALLPFDCMKKMGCGYIVRREHQAPFEFRASRKTGLFSKSTRALGAKLSLLYVYMGRDYREKDPLPYIHVEIKAAVSSAETAFLMYLCLPSGDLTMELSPVIGSTDTVQAALSVNSPEFGNNACITAV